MLASNAFLTLRAWAACDLFARRDATKTIAVCMPSIIAMCYFEIKLRQIIKMSRTLTTGIFNAHIVANSVIINTDLEMPSK